MSFKLRMIVIFFTGIALGAILYAYTPEFFRTINTEPSPNLISISTRIDTAGQPSEEQLIGLKQAGYDMVINLAPPDAIGSIENEGGLVTRTGLAYVNIPVDWNKPDIDDFHLFSDLLDITEHRHILVHCQVNRRASLFTFLYRVVHEHADVDEEYEKVTLIWSPEPHWLEFANNVMSDHRIDFEPL
jgi:protein tyrosine phosphatase (PTP) superfamily phosphohydrolase (DUF442 family)